MKKTFFQLIQANNAEIILLTPSGVNLAQCIYKKALINCHLDRSGRLHGKNCSRQSYCIPAFHGGQVEEVELRREQQSSYREISTHGTLVVSGSDKIPPLRSE